MCVEYGSIAIVKTKIRACLDGQPDVLAALLRKVGGKVENSVLMERSREKRAELQQEFRRILESMYTRRESES